MQNLTMIGAMSTRQARCVEQNVRTSLRLFLAQAYSSLESSSSSMADSSCPELESAFSSSSSSVGGRTPTRDASTRAAHSASVARSPSWA